MATLDENGIVEIATSKSVKERGFNCMQLIKFLTEKGVREWNEWHNAHMSAAKGECEFAGECAIYARTSKKPIQMRLF